MNDWPQDIPDDITAEGADDAATRADRLYREHVPQQQVQCYECATYVPATTAHVLIGSDGAFCTEECHDAHYRNRELDRLERLGR